MSGRQTLIIRGDDDVVRARLLFRRFWRQCCEAGRGMTMTVAPYAPPRTLDQNALLHAALTDISRQVEFAGSLRSVDEWKAIMVSGHAAHEGRPVELVEGLEGEALALRESTARMPKARMTSLIDYVLSQGAEMGVEWSREDQIEEWREAAKGVRARRVA